MKQSNDNDEDNRSFRRNWDSDEYAKKARDKEKQTKIEEENEERRLKGERPKRKRAQDSESTTETRELLQARKHSINLEGMIGKVQVVQASTAASGQPGFYCKSCDVVVKDSMAYLDHINGKNHQRMLNRSMKVSKEALGDVLAKLQSLREAKRRQETKSEYSFQEEVKRRQQLEAEKKERRRIAKRRHRQQQQQQNSAGRDEDRDDIGSAMGFASFGSTKK